ncbi:MAG: HD domain-containing phosphohydrolase [Actinomycetota bacterium]
MTTGPTGGAVESGQTRWERSPIAAAAIRVLVVVIPFVVAWVGVSLLSAVFLRADGPLGIVLWLLQAVVVGAAIATVVERVTRKALPMATLLNLTLVFPDQAPSRFSLALRTGTVRRLQERLDEVKADGLGRADGEAPARAAELIALLSSHDRLTRGHTERVRAYADLIAEEMGLSDQDRDRLAWGALLHDVGKLFVDPDILNKDGRPDEDEWAVLRRHPATGEALLEPLAEWLGPWTLAASQHHERWDGNGYPAGLAGRDISLAGRIVAVADAYDVITSRRSYKKPMSAAAAREELARCAGSQFDPEVVRAFLNVSLGRRWSAGPLAPILELPGLANVGVNIGATMPAASTVVVGSAAVVGSLTVPGAIGTPPVDQLAFAATGTGEVLEGWTPQEGAGRPPATGEEVGEPSTTAPPLEAVATTTSTLAPDTSSSTTEPDTSTTTIGLPNLDQGTLGTDLPATTAPTTTAAPAVTTTADPAPTTSKVPTTKPSTTASTQGTTTTVASTTTDPPAIGPEANDDAVTVEEEQEAKIKVLSNDDAGDAPLDPSTLEIIDEPDHASSFRVRNGQIRYTSDEDFEGVDELRYRICDVDGLCDTAWVTITVVDD